MTLSSIERSSSGFFSAASHSGSESETENVCGICLDPLIEPLHETSCSHTFHKNCLETALALHNLCPMCRHPDPLPEMVVIPVAPINHDSPRTCINKWKQLLSSRITFVGVAAFALSALALKLTYDSTHARKIVPIFIFTLIFGGVCIIIGICNQLRHACIPRNQPEV